MSGNRGAKNFLSRFFDYEEHPEVARALRGRLKVMTMLVAVPVTLGMYLMVFESAFSVKTAILCSVGVSLIAFLLWNIHYLEKYEDR